MSRNQNKDLRNAMKNLQVSLPMKLKGGPNFQPPAPPAVNHLEAPRVAVPPFQASPYKVAQIKEALSEPPPLQRAQIDQAHVEPPQNEVPQNESEDSQSRKIEAETTEFSRNENARNKLPQIEEARAGLPRSRQTKIECAQNEHSITEQVRTELAQNQAVQKKVPQIEETGNQQAQFENAEAVTTGGFFKLSHNIFQEPLVRKMSGDCFRLFLWLSARAWRFPNSIGEVRASVRFMEDHTGMGHATISRSLKTLKQVGLLTQVETDFKRGNLWLVSSLACGNRGPEDFPPRSEVPRNERTRKETTSASK